MTTFTPSPEALHAVDHENAKRAHMGEQAWNVGIRLRSWMEAPTGENWARVLDAVDGYPGPYFTFQRPGGVLGSDRRALARESTSLRGRRFVTTFRKGSRTWTKPR